MMALLAETLCNTMSYGSLFVSQRYSVLTNQIFNAMAYRNNYNRKNGLHKIEARFNCKCNETGLTIKKGESMWYNYDFKTCYHMSSTVAQENEKLASMSAQNDGEGHYPDLDDMLEQQAEQWSRNC